MMKMQKYALNGTFWLETMQYDNFLNILNNIIRDIQCKNNNHTSHNITFRQ